MLPVGENPMAIEKHETQESGTTGTTSSPHLTLAMLSLTRLILSSSSSSLLVRRFAIRPALCSNGSSKKPPQIQQKIDDYEEDKPLNARYRLKLLVRDYGTSAMVVHISISLVSLGLCYTAVSTGLPITEFVHRTGLFTESATKYLTSGSTFGLAYFVHKCLLPLRLMLTTIITPMLVQTLRHKGILKPMADKSKQGTKQL